ncbi:ATP-binding protein [Citrobacter braakii]|uniref:ATP-binding protein n=1 Tax=Citrobacter braakii TaxID=57706 RepID=UPI001F60C555|nr:ATP-binding protein [Citrobacter braakii]
MSQYIKIKKILITGAMLDNVLIEFGSKLTIITGGSDSGKTYLFNLIRYLLGSDKLENAGINEAKGYDSSFIEFSINENSYSIERGLHDNSEYKLYSGGIDTISPATFIQKIVKSAKSKNSFNSIFYSKLGFKKAQVRINNNGGVQNFNLSNVLDFFFIDEIRILTSKSMLLSEQYAEQIKSKSEFKFLLTKRDDALIGEEKPNKKAKIFLKQQVKDIIDGLSRDLIFPDLNFLLINEALHKVETQIENAAIEVDNFLELYENKVTVINEIKNEIGFLQKKSSYISMLIDRFKMLKDCYLSDLQRINSISQATFFLENFAEELCDNCGHTINHSPEINYEDYYASCMAESEKINIQLAGLLKSIKSNEDELSSINLSIKESEFLLNLEMPEYERLHDVDLKNSRRVIEELYEHKECLLSDYSKHQIISALESKGDNLDLDVYNSDDFDDLKVDEIKEVINQLRFVLNSIKFDGRTDNSVEFDENKYDFIINEKERSLFGKGSRAVIYACFVISLADVLARKGNPQTGFVLLDSPLVTHFDKKREIKESEVNPLTLTDAFYSYLINSNSTIQVILIENKGPSFTVENNDDIKLIDLNFDGATGVFPKKSIN